MTFTFNFKVENVKYLATNGNINLTGENNDFGEVEDKESDVETFI